MVSKHRQSLHLDLEPSKAMTACRRAVSEMGWRVLEESEAGLVAKEEATTAIKFTWPAKIEVVLSPEEPGTSIELRAVGGMGPIQAGHLKGQMGALQNKIILAAGGSAVGGSGSPAGGDVGTELEKLAQLKESGALRDEEFAQAKGRLLGGE